MNAHVRVDVFRELVSKRKQAWNEFILIIVFGLPFLITLLYYTWILFYISWLQGEGSDSMTGIDWRWAIKFAMPAGAVLLSMATLATLGRLFVYLFGSGAVQAEAESMIQIFSDNHDDLDAIREQVEHALEDEVKHVQEHDKKGH
jgi:TRAP-type mannitol/chloroaromatic compound transport system permease small subunit